LLPFRTSFHGFFGHPGVILGPLLGLLEARKGILEGLAALYQGLSSRAEVLSEPGGRGQEYFRLAPEWDVLYAF